MTNENVQVVYPTKPGYVTTEFWVALAVAVITIIQSYAGNVSPQFASGVTAVIAVAYAVCRAFVKSFGQGDTGAAGGEVQEQDTPASPPPSPSFPRLVTPTVLFLAMALLMAGCAQTEYQRVAQGAILVTVHAETATWLHDNGITTPEQEAVIVEDLKAEQAAIHAYYVGIDAGDSNAVAAAKAALAAAASVTESELAKYPAKPK